MDNNIFKQDNDLNIHYYTELVNRYGIDVQSLNWGSSESQKLRFSILSQVGPLKGAKVLDVGCGLGDFYAWLEKNDIMAEYTGIDITPAMVENARQRFPKTRFEVFNLLEDGCDIYDYVVASGIFTRRLREPITYLEKMIHRAYELARKAVAFNSLSSWATDQEANEFYANPLAVLGFCRTITPWVVMRHDYLPHDFTIYMYRRD